jgi:3-hydroxyacyl-CoA dehydrogenase
VTRILALTATLAAFAALALAAPALAAEGKPSLVDDVAARLGVTPDKLRAAFKAALTARVDAAVKAGRLTPEQAARLKQRIAAGAGLGIGARKAFAQHQKAFRGRIAKARAHAPVATYLGMTREQLRAELRSGKSLAQIAKEKGKSVDGLVAAMLAPVKARLAKAVENGRLTKTRADAILARLTEGATKLVQRAPATR